MKPAEDRGFRFGIEAEFLLVEAGTYRPLWHPDLSFAALNEALEAIPFADLPSLDGLDLEPPHRKLMPFVVEGYHLPAPDYRPTDLLPKGVEIRTPVCTSIDQCLDCLHVLHDRLQRALAGISYQPASLSHHPVEHYFEGPQNKRRHDFWQWAMEAMLTYGPDVNVSLPAELSARLDVGDLDAKVNHYAPALTALTLASPLYRGGLWEIRGRVGKSIRTYRRSVVAPAIEVHPEEGWRLEFKTFEATRRLEDCRNYFLLWLALLLDEGLTGRASRQSRVYDLGAAARLGLEADTLHDRAAVVLDRAPDVLESWGFDPSSLASFRRRLETGRLPADDLIDLFRRTASIPDVLRQSVGLVSEGGLRACQEDVAASGRSAARR